MPAININNIIIRVFWNKVEKFCRVFIFRGDPCSVFAALYVLRHCFNVSRGGFIPVFLFCYGLIAPAVVNAGNEFYSDLDILPQRHKPAVFIFLRNFRCL